VLFDVGSAAAKTSDVNPMLQATARYLNTLAKVGVPASSRKIAVIFHQGGTRPPSEERRLQGASNDGRTIPTSPSCQALKKAGVEFHVCGQRCSR
jgi:intracellular sulfur oxidation DsrE/DsrF family protein